LLGLAACASTTEQAASVRQVDDLLTNIEAVQVDVTLAKDKAHAALQHLTTLVSPKFTGDATKAYEMLVVGITESEEQTLALRNSVEPMAEAAESVFSRWAADLEAFGNTRMRQRSQSRLDETRNRYHTLLTSSQSALLSFDSFNADMRDQALFLGSDLNASAIAAITPDVRILHQQVQDLDARAEACANAARAYVESAALYGQVEAVTTDVQPGQGNGGNNSAANDKPKTQFTKKRASTLKPQAQVPASRPAVEVVTPPEQTPEGTTTDPNAPVNIPGKY
jgi:hypothetical protein